MSNKMQFKGWESVVTDFICASCNVVNFLLYTKFHYMKLQAKSYLHAFFNL